jgi:predicted regulator of Ras-like GTPase activity (Roadblock/LC7/MglB family)
VIAVAALLTAIGALAFFMAGRAFGRRAPLASSDAPVAVAAAPPLPPPPPAPSLPVGPTAAELELRARLEAAAHELHALRLLAGRGRLTLPPLDADALPALQHFTEQAGKSPGMTSLVVADDLGLLVAGTSPRADELAALGGFLVGAGDRVRNLAALGPLARVMVEDTRGATASVTPLPGTDLVAVAVQEPLGGQPA